MTVGADVDQDLPFLFFVAHSEPSDTTCAQGIQSCLEDLDRTLLASGCQLDDVVRVTTYLPKEQMTVDGYVEYNVVYREFFNEHNIYKKPARATIGVRTFAGLGEVQMEAIALRP